MFRALLWKEWREQRWKAAFGSVILVGFLAVGLRSRLFLEDGIFVMTGVLGSFVLPILVAMGMFASEKMEGSHHFLAALPAPRRTIVSAKVLAALLVTLIPLICLFLAYEAMATSLFAKKLEIYCCFLWLAINVLIWTAGLGIRARSESRVALAGLIVLVSWFCCLAIFARDPSSLKFTLILVPLGFLMFVGHPEVRESYIILGVHIMYSIFVLYILFKLMVWHLNTDRREDR